jgi:glutathione S-transferase
MTLELLEMRHSPYCIPIVRMLEACSVPFKKREIPNWDRREIGRLTGGHYYQVPVLIDGHDIVHDSPADPYRLARHVDVHHCGGCFFPAEWEGVHEILLADIEGRLEEAGFKLCDIHYVPSILDDGERAMVIRHKERRFGVGCLDQWTNERNKLQATFLEMLEPLDQRFRASAFLLGPDPVFADFALYGVLGNYTFQGWNELPDRLESLQDWFDRVRSWVASPT